MCGILKWIKFLSEKLRWIKTRGQNYIKNAQNLKMYILIEIKNESKSNRVICYIIMFWINQKLLILFLFWNLIFQEYMHTRNIGWLFSMTFKNPKSIMRYCVIWFFSHQLTNDCKKYFIWPRCDKIRNI